MLWFMLSLGHKPPIAQHSGSRKHSFYITSSQGFEMEHTMIKGYLFTIFQSLFGSSSPWSSGTPVNTRDELQMVP